MTPVVWILLGTIGLLLTLVLTLLSRMGAVRHLWTTSARDSPSSTGEVRRWVSGAVGASNEEMVARMESALEATTTLLKDVAIRVPARDRPVPPVIVRSDWLADVSYELYFSSPDDLDFGPDAIGPRERLWLQRLLGPAHMIVRGFETVREFTERYVEFSPDLVEKLRSGAATLMRSADGTRAIVTEGGQIIGHGVLRSGPSLAQGAASIYGSVVAAAYMIVARDVQKQLREMDQLLRTIVDAGLCARQARLEAVYESIRRISQAAYPEDRAVLLLLLTDLHELRASLRSEVRDLERKIVTPNALSGWMFSKRHDHALTETFNGFRSRLAQTDQILTLEAMTISMLSDPMMEGTFVRTVADEGRRMREMHSILSEAWDRERRGKNPEPPELLNDLTELARLYEGASGGEQALTWLERASGDST